MFSFLGVMQPQGGTSRGFACQSRRLCDGHLIQNQGQTKIQIIIFTPWLITTNVVHLRVPVEIGLLLDKDGEEEGVFISTERKRKAGVSADIMERWRLNILGVQDTRWKWNILDREQDAEVGATRKEG